MLFADKSGSMSGTPFNAMKKGMLDLAPVIFPDEQDTSMNPFKEVHTVFYGSDIFPKVSNSRQQYLTNVGNEYVSGMTNFVDCFKHIEKVLGNVEPGSKFSIIFLTDGNDTRNNKSQVEKTSTDLKTILKNLYETKNVSSSIFCLGFSRDHDAPLLNKLA